MMAVGSGSLTREDSRRVTRDWEQQARGGPGAPKRRPSQRDYLQQVTAMGLQVVEN